MSGLLQLFLNNLLPIFLTAGAGYLVGRLLDINPRPVSQLTFYIFTPCLIFNLLVHSQLRGGEVAQMFGFAGLLMVVVGLIAWLVGRLQRFDRRTQAAVVIASMFMNAGNFGLPVILFAFGETTLSYASVFFVTSAVLNTSLGAVIASTGSLSLRQAALNLVKLPTLYALILALLVLGLGWKVPLPLERTSKLLGDAAIPGMAIMLGMQFLHSNWSFRAAPLVTAGALRLLAAPLLAVGMSLAWGLRGPALQAGVLEAAMPSAVLNSVLATEFDLDPAFVTAVILASTLLSPLTLTPLMAILS